MLRKYGFFVKTIVSEFIVRFPIYARFEDDLESECFLAVEKCINSFSPRKGVFYAYWRKTANRAMHKFVSKTRIKMDSYLLSMDYELFPNYSLHDVVGLDDEQGSNDLLNQTFLTIVNNPNNHFTNEETKIIKLFLFGYEFKDIALLLNLSKSQVYYGFKVAVAKIGEKMKFPKR